MAAQHCPCDTSEFYHGDACDSIKLGTGVRPIAAKLQADFTSVETRRCRLAEMSVHASTRAKWSFLTFANNTRKSLRRNDLKIFCDDFGHHGV
jgi:hypothetical protein